MFSPPSFTIEWSQLLSQIIFAGERVYYMFLGLGYWFTAPISEALGSPFSPFYLEFLGPFLRGLTAVEFILNKVTDGLYGYIITGLVGTDSVTGISLLSIIACNILLLVFLRFVKWLWDVLPIV